MQALAERAALRPLPVFPLAELSLGPAVLADDACLAAGAWPAGAEPANQYYRARYYDPRLGRFLSEDPIGLKAGVNRYGYVRNVPTRLVDPMGLQEEPPSDEPQVPQDPPSPEPSPTPCPRKPVKCADCYEECRKVARACKDDCTHVPGPGNFDPDKPRCLERCNEQWFECINNCTKNCDQGE